MENFTEKESHKTTPNQFTEPLIIDEPLLNSLTEFLNYQETKNPSVLEKY